MHLGIEVADVGRGVLVAFGGVLAQLIGAHARRDARRHSCLPETKDDRNDEHELDCASARVSRFTRVSWRGCARET